jgi:DNA repair exonuclease SbcCD nuclease subunit
VDELRTATRRAFARLIDCAIDERVDFVVIAGDLYDGTWKDFNTGLFFQAQMGRLRASRIRAIVLHGNHDAASEITRTLHLPDNVRVLDTRAPETVRWDDLGVAVHGQGFRERDVRDNLAASYPEAVPGWLNIGVLHTALMGHALHAPYAPCSLDELRAKGYQYWALGHVHEYQELVERPRIVFPGNLQGRHARETGPHGAVLVTAEGDEIVAATRVVLDVLRWAHVQVDVTRCQAMEELMSCVDAELRWALAGSEGRPVAARVSLCGKTSLHGELFGCEREVRENVLAVAAGLGSGLIWIEKVRLETEPVLSDSALLARADAVSELWGVLVDAANDSELMGTLRRELSDVLQRAPAEVRGSEAFAIETVRANRLDELVRHVARDLIARVSEPRGS